MYVIKDSHPPPVAIIDGCIIRAKVLHKISSRLSFTTLVSSLLAAWLVLTGGPARAVDVLPTKSIAQITIDDDGRDLLYPSAVFFDPFMNEIYVVNSIIGRVVIYGPDFFPRISIGRGRGVVSPSGGTVLSNGDVYICQIRNAKNPRPRITILNGAFFIDREIYLDQIPEAAGLMPKTLAVSNEGTIYLAGDDYRGVLVLDNAGNFLRWLKPLDKIYAYAYAEIEASQKEQGKLPPEEQEDIASEDEFSSDIPEEFRPRTRSEKKASGTDRVTGPVKVNYVTSDSTGKLYLLSAETGKIYVYAPDESFLFSFGSKGGSPGQMSNPRGFAIDEELGLIYIIDYMRHTILAHNMTGKFLFEVGGRGFSPGWFNFPNDISLNSLGQLIVADQVNNRVQVLEVFPEAIDIILKRLQDSSLTEATDTLELTEQDELAPSQPEDLSDEENIPQAPPEQTDTIIEEEIIQELDIIPLYKDSPDDQDTESETSPDQLEKTGQLEPEPVQEAEEVIVKREPPEKSLLRPEDEILPATPGQQEQATPPAEDKGVTTPPPAAEATAKLQEAEMPAAKLPDFAAVEPFVASWAEAWEQKNIVTYLSHYSRNFITPDGMSITTWEKNRYQVLAQQKVIKIKIRDMQKTTINDSRVQVTFIQNYQSEEYTEEVLKTLDLIWENGEWLIENETSSELF